MNYKDISKENKKGLFSVLESYGIDLAKADSYLLNNNPKMRNVYGQFYLENLNLFNNLISL